MHTRDMVHTRYMLSTRDMGHTIDMLNKRDMEHTIDKVYTRYMVHTNKFWLVISSLCTINPLYSGTP